MAYIAPCINKNTTKVAEDKLTPDLRRICPICSDKWTGIGAQLILHILRKHADDLLIQQEKYRDDNSDFEKTDFTEYVFILIDNDDKDIKIKKSTPKFNEIVKVFVEFEKIFVITIRKFPDEFTNRGFTVSVNYIGPYSDRIDCMKFTCILQYDLNNRKCLSSISDVVGQTARFIIDDDINELKQPLSRWPVIIKVQINVPEKFQQLIDAMKSRLTCFRCNAMMLPPIRHCRFGHIICKSCRQKIESRPLCPSCYRNSSKFNENCDSQGDIHPAMRLKVPNDNLAGDSLGTGDVFAQMSLGGNCLRSNVGNLRLLEEEALQVAYCCNVAGCQMWISCLDLEQHQKECH